MRSLLFLALLVCCQPSSQTVEAPSDAAREAAAARALARDLDALRESSQELKDSIDTTPVSPKICVGDCMLVRDRSVRISRTAP